MSRRAQINPNLDYDDKVTWKQLNQNVAGRKRSREIEYDQWVSGSEPANYLLNDPMLDWLKYYYNELGLNYDEGVVTRSKRRKLDANREDNKNNKNNNEVEYLHMLLDNGQKFERLVNDAIIRRFPGEVVTVAVNGRSDCNLYNYKKTQNAMLDGIPIILQGVLMNNINKTKGVADIIIRSDYVNRLVTRKEVFEHDVYRKAPKLNGEYHYLIIDIKWTGMVLCANGRSIRNEGRFKAYKGQLAIYNSILGQMQGYTPRYSYVLAKSWKIGSTVDPSEGWNCFDLLGTIDYAQFDYDHIARTVNGINWVRNVRKNGRNWTPMAPVVPEMYPNSSNANDAPWTSIKKKIIAKTDEITKTWFVSPEHRNRAVAQGVTKWSDPRCTVELLGINDGVRARVIKEILSINQQTNDLVRPVKIKNNKSYWQRSSPVDFTIDFETISDCLNTEDMDITNSKAYSNIIFWIGVGWTENNEWRYKAFVMKSYSLEEECRIIDEATKFISEKTLELDPQKIYVPRLFHWSPAEPSVFANVNARHSYKWLQWEYTVEWVDMCEVFTSEPVVVKGALCFKLKEICRALYSHGLIATKWDDDGPSDGLAAMNEAIRYYEKVQRNTITDTDKQKFIAVGKYNEVDCKVLWETLHYLRQHHCGPTLENNYTNTLPNN